jgi:hypothetical protein
MSYSLLLDASVVAFMGYATTSEQVIGAVELLREISLLTSKFREMPLLGPPRFELCVYDSGCFPFHDHVRELLNSTGLGDVFDPQLITTLLNSVVQRMVSIADVTSVNDVLVQSVVTQPAKTYLGGNVTLEEAFDQLLAFYAAAQIEGETWAARASVTLSSICEPSPQLEVECDIALVEPPLCGGSIVSFSATHQISRVQDRAAFYSNLIPQALWADAVSPSDVEMAITAKAFQLRIVSGLDALPQSCEEFELGPYFVESLSGAQAAHNSPYAAATLDKCARLVAGLPLPDDNPFYTAAGSQSQRVRSSDGAMARRVHVSKGGIAVRLMYWRMPNGTIEFSNVEPKANTIIYE